MAGSVHLVGVLLGVPVSFCVLAVGWRWVDAQVIAILSSPVGTRLGSQWLEFGSSRFVHSIETLLAFEHVSCGRSCAQTLGRLKFKHENSIISKIWVRILSKMWFFGSIVAAFDQFSRNSSSRPFFSTRKLAHNKPVLYHCTNISFPNYPITVLIQSPTLKPKNSTSTTLFANGFKQTHKLLVSWD